MEAIFNFIFCNNLQVPVIAVITVILTGFLKMPVKRLAAKMKNGQKLTKYITFMPFITGFGATALVVFLCAGEVDFDNAFFINWLSGVSLSLAIYAFWEKFVPTEKKILTQAEINENKVLLDELKNVLTDRNNALPQAAEQTDSEENPANDNHEKIILTNHKTGE